MAPSVGTVGRVYIPRTGDEDEEPLTAGVSSGVNQWSHPLDDLLQQADVVFLTFTLVLFRRLYGKCWYVRSCLFPCAKSHNQEMTVPIHSPV